MILSIVRWGVILTLCLVTLVTVVTVIENDRCSSKSIDQLQQRVDSLESRIYTIETLYRSHLEECSFISKYDIQVGYDNYLRLRKDDDSIRNK
jgi:hypothetical protein